jgi:hypothetical protein
MPIKVGSAVGVGNSAAHLTVGRGGVGDGISIPHRGACDDGGKGR